MVALLLAVFAASAIAQPPADSQRFRIQVERDGVYRLAYDRLESAGLTGPVASDRLAMENLGKRVALRVDDGGDALFGPGDSLVFIGEHLRGDASHYHDFSPFNVYVLDIGAQTEPLRMRGSAGPPGSDGAVVPTALRGQLHMEHDLLRIPVSGQPGAYEEETLWYWLQLNHLASAPTRIPVDLSRVDRHGEKAFELKLQFRGWSNSASASHWPIPDHVVEVALNGTPIAKGRWQGRDTHLIEISRIPSALLEPAGDVIEIRVPTRRHGDNADPVIDVVYLDWIAAAFPRASTSDHRQDRLVIPADGNTGLLRLRPESPPGAAEVRRVELFGEAGFAAPMRQADDSPAAFEASIPAGAQRIWTVPDERFEAPSTVVLDRPSNLAASRDQRDYFIIAHPDLVASVEPLARFHQERGTRTELVDVQDIYDEFNHGIKHPQAIRDFLAHARRVRNAPAPSMVLLVGDASWFARSSSGPGVESARFDEKDLIPSWQLRSRDGPAASDNPFVTLDGDDLYPDMAIGRFPAASPSEASAMVAKTIAYMTDPPPGSWRSRILLASDPTGNFSARNSQLARRARDRGLTADELLADPSDAGTRHQERMRSAIDEGMLVLHFFGHGGRFMWQTAPARGDAGNLFGMEDLDMLAPSARLPIVLSMSCATGPFDHPAADSLAEKFLRMADRGAVAVLAASARNSPSLGFTNSLLEGILTSGTLGEAVRAAKSARMHPDSALFYNLFGDPALVPARPENGMASDGETAE